MLGRCCKIIYVCRYFFFHNSTYSCNETLCCKSITKTNAQFRFPCVFWTSSHQLVIIIIWDECVSVFPRSTAACIDFGGRRGDCNLPSSLAPLSPVLWNLVPWNWSIVFCSLPRLACLRPWRHIAFPLSLVWPWWHNVALIRVWVLLTLQLVNH